MSVTILFTTFFLIKSVSSTNRACNLKALSPGHAANVLASCFTRGYYAILYLEFTSKYLVPSIYIKYKFLNYLRLSSA